MVRPDARPNPTKAQGEEGGSIVSDYPTQTNILIRQVAFFKREREYAQEDGKHEKIQRMNSVYVSLLAALIVLQDGD